VEEALGAALEQIGPRLEQGLHEAERELVDLRARCVTLEPDIRAMHAALDALTGDPPPPPLAVDPDRRQPGTVVIPDTPAVAAAAEGEVVITIPPAEETAGRAAVASRQREDRPRDRPGDGPGGGPGGGPEDRPAGQEQELPPSSYMPMLEELWAIARGEDAEGRAGDPSDDPR